VRYVRMPIEVESPEEYGYANIRYNLAESSIADRTLTDLGLTIPNLVLAYNEHRGTKALRELIAAQGKGLQADDVLVTNGAAGALFVIATALLGPQDHLVVVKPNYGLNIETPRAIGCAITYVDVAFENGFKTDLAKLKASITPQTRLISVTCPHNPSGVMYSAAELQQLVDIARAHKCYLLVDETYRDLSYDLHLPVAATLGGHVISVASLSKAYGAPGTRMGWLVTTDKTLLETLLAAKEQTCICGSVVDEWIATQILANRDKILAPVLAEMRRRRQMVADWIAGEPLLEWTPPDGGVIGFIHMKQEPPGGVAAFYQRLLDVHGTYVAPGHWFELPDTFFRLGFGFPTADALQAGLKGLSAALKG
jgi:aspartate/methionine/tyrosine aminotransferase